MSDLKRAGAIEVTPQYGSDKHQRASVFTIYFEGKLPAMAQSFNPDSRNQDKKGSLNKKEGETDMETRREPIQLVPRPPSKARIVGRIAGMLTDPTKARDLLSDKGIKKYATLFGVTGEELHALIDKARAA